MPTMNTNEMNATFISWKRLIFMTLLCSHNKGQINSFYIDVHINAPTKMKNTLTAFGPFISAFLQFYFSCPFPTYLLDHSMLLAKKKLAVQHGNSILGNEKNIIIC